LKVPSPLPSRTATPAGARCRRLASTQCDEVELAVSVEICDCDRIVPSPPAFEITRAVKLSPDISTNLARLESFAARLMHSLTSRAEMKNIAAEGLLRVGVPDSIDQRLKRSEGRDQRGETSRFMITLFFRYLEPAESMVDRGREGKIACRFESSNCHPLWADGQAAESA